jgi:hypothetical protein
MSSLRSPFLIGVGAALAACATDPPPSQLTAASLVLLSPAQVTGTPGWEISDTVVVLALDKAGQPLPGAALTWSAPGDSLTPLAPETDSAGRMRVAWRLGLPEGIRTLTIASGHATPLTVQATSTTLHAVSLTSGDGFNCAIDASQKAWCWGANFVGTLGRGFASPTPSDTAVPVSGGISFTTLSAAKAASFACGLDAAGAAYCWGSNAGGQLGSGAVDDTALAPRPVATALRFSQISANGPFPRGTTCGLTAQGEAWCWGSNEYAQLGDSTLLAGFPSSRLSPVRVQSSETFASVKVGFFHSCALTGTGAMYCWGLQQGDTGAFGAKPPAYYPTPMPVASSFQFIDVAFGNNLTCGLTTAHLAYCWGLNWFGGLGHGDTTTLAPDPLLVAGGHTFQALANGNFEQIFGLDEDGLAYTWGSPACCDVSQNTPLLMDANLHFSNMDGQQDPFEACGVDSNGAVYCTGYGTRQARGVPVRNGP